LGGRKGIRPVKKWGDGGGGHWLVQTEWRPAGWSVFLPLLIFPCTIKKFCSGTGSPGWFRKKGRKPVWWWLWWPCTCCTKAHLWLLFAVVTITCRVESGRDNASFVAFCCQAKDKKEDKQNKLTLHEQKIVWPGFEAQKPKGIKISTHLQVLVLSVLKGKVTETAKVTPLKSSLASSP